MRLRWSGAIAVEADRAQAQLPPEIDPLRFQPELPQLGGHTVDRLSAWLRSLAIDNSTGSELEGYLHEALHRVVYTVDMVPQSVTRALEIGANPYFMTTLMRTFRPCDLTLTNFFSMPVESGTLLSQQVSLAGWEGRDPSFEAKYHHLNIETDDFPFGNGQFDAVLFCEVIEHMTNDPLHALREIHRVLQPQGHLILTTPNVARLENVARLVSGTNLYDPYSGYGPYGRHNREYTRHELWRLLTHCGFEPEVMFTADVIPNVTASYRDARLLVPILTADPGRVYDLGQYHFMRWRKAGPPDQRKPQWLYRSYPGDQLDPAAL